MEWNVLTASVWMGWTANRRDVKKAIRGAFPPNSTFVTGTTRADTIPWRKIFVAWKPNGCMPPAIQWFHLKVKTATGRYDLWLLLRVRRVPQKSLNKMFDNGDSVDTSWLFSTASESSKTNCPFNEFMNVTVPIMNTINAETFVEIAETFRQQKLK